MGLGSVAITLQLCTFNLSLAAAVEPSEPGESGVFLGALLPVPKGSPHDGRQPPPVDGVPRGFRFRPAGAGAAPAYRYAAAVHQSQAALPGTLAVLEAFRRGLPALFEPCRIDPNRDGFAALVLSQFRELWPSCKPHRRAGACPRLLPWSRLAAGAAQRGGAALCLRLSAIARLPHHR